MVDFKAVFPFHVHEESNAKKTASLRVVPGLIRIIPGKTRQYPHSKKAAPLNKFIPQISIAAKKIDMQSSGANPLSPPGVRMKNVAASKSDIEIGAFGNGGVVFSGDDQLGSPLFPNKILFWRSEQSPILINIVHDKTQVQGAISQSGEIQARGQFKKLQRECAFRCE